MPVRDVFVCDRCRQFRAGTKHTCNPVAERVSAILSRFNATHARTGEPCVFTRTSDFDALGRCSFSIYWVDEGRPRGQMFFAVPGDHVTHASEAT